MNSIQFINTTPNDLVNQLKTEILKELKETIKENAPTKFVSADEVCNHFKITKPTLFALKRKGLFNSYRLGGRVYYKLDEIENSMIVND